MADDTAPVPHLTADTTFAVVPTWVLAQASSRAVHLYGILRRYADTHGAAYPSRATLADRLECSLDTVDRALRVLVSIGAVTVERRWTPKGDPTSSLYRLHSQPAGNPVDNRGGSRTGAARGSRTDAATVAAPVRHERKPLNEKNPQPQAVPGGCPAHPIPAPRCRACGTSPRQLAAAARASRPEWCGACAEDTRLVDDGDHVRRCPACHPLAVKS